MSKRKEPETVSIPVAKFYDRVAWLVWHGAHQDANALRELAAWFEPPITVDEGRIERRVAMFISDALLRPGEMLIGD